MPELTSIVFIDEQAQSCNHAIHIQYVQDTSVIIVNSINTLHFNYSPFLQSFEEKELGNAAYKKKDFETALAHYKNAIELDPTNASFLTNRAGQC